MKFRILASEQLILMYTDIEQSFDLTTDASMDGIGAVLSQGGKPITMILRTLEQSKTKERELLAIV